MKLKKRQIARLAHVVASAVLRQSEDELLEFVVHEFREDYSAEDIEEWIPAITESVNRLADRHEREAARRPL